MEASTRERLRDRLLDLFDNPVLRLELRHVGTHLRRPWRLLAGWRYGAHPSRQAAAYLVWSPVTVLAPYLFPAFVQYMVGVVGGAFGRAAPFPASFGALLVYGYAFLACTGLLQWAAFSFTRERDQGVMESLLTSRLTAAEIVLGKVGAVALPACAAGSVAFVVWLLFPPITRDSHVFGFRFDQPTRLLLLCLWLDLVATSTAGAFVGVAVAAWCRTARAATAAAVLLTLPVVLLVMPAVMIRMPAWMFSQQTAILPAAVHPALWGLSGALALVAFVVAQVRLNPVPMRVTLIPGGSTRIRLSPTAVSASLALAVLLLLAGAGVLGSHAVRTVVSTTSALSPSGSGQQALRLARQGQHRQALTMLDTEIQRGASGTMGAMLWGAKGDCHLELREFTKAIAAYDDLGSLSKLPAHTAGALRGKGECYLEMGRRRDAAAMFRQAIQASQQAGGSGGALAMPMTRLVEVEVLRAARGLASLGHRDEALKAYQTLLGSGNARVENAAREGIAITREGLLDAPRMGIRYRRGTGTIVDSVQPDSGAADAGILAGDRVLSVDGKPVDGSMAVLRALAPHKPGDVVPVVVERAGQQLTVSIRLSPPQ